MKIFWIVFKENACLLCTMDYFEYGNDYSPMAMKFRNAKTVEDIVQCISEGGNPNAIFDEHLTTHFIHHCYEGNTDIVKYLVEFCNVNIEISDVYGNTGFHQICYRGHVDLFDYLVSVV